jgi:hypothetical protein
VSGRFAALALIRLRVWRAAASTVIMKIDLAGPA